MNFVRYCASKSAMGGRGGPIAKHFIFLSNGIADENVRNEPLIRFPRKE